MTKLLKVFEFVSLKKKNKTKLYTKMIENVRILVTSIIQIVGLVERFLGTKIAWSVILLQLIWKLKTRVISQNITHP